MNTLKAWVSLIALIVTGITASDIVPVSGNAHKIWVVVVIVVGAFLTWLVPPSPSFNTPKSNSKVINS